MMQRAKCERSRWGIVRSRENEAIWLASFNQTRNDVILALMLSICSLHKRRSHISWIFIALYPDDISSGLARMFQWAHLRTSKWIKYQRLSRCRKQCLSNSCGILTLPIKSRVIFLLFTNGYRFALPAVTLNLTIKYQKYTQNQRNRSITDGKQRNSFILKSICWQKHEQTGQETRGCW